jgi:hypothetical protein
LHPPRPGYPRINARVPCFSDCEVFVVDRDGVEHDIGADLTAIKFECAQGTEPARVILEGVNVEIDADALLAPQEPPKTVPGA